MPRLLMSAIIATLATCAPVCSAAARDLVRDPKFQRGFKVYAPKPGKKVLAGLLQWDASAGEPVWDLAQWSSKHTLAGAKAVRLPDGSVRFANQAKAVTVAPDGRLTLALNASEEYGGRARRKGERWPHLLVAQRFRDPPSVADLDRLVVHVEARLARSVLHKTPDYPPRRHAAQFQIFLSVQNLNRRSKGYGDFLYFGIPLYDSRWRETKPFQQPDAYSKFIYTPPARAYMSESLHDGGWVSVHRNVLPLILQGLNTAWGRGFLQDSKDLADYRVAAMNMGWEVPGILDAEIEVKGLSIKATEG